MRVLVDIADRDGELVVIVTAPGGLTAERPVAWTGAGKRLLAAKEAAATMGDPVALADAVEAGQASDEQLARYGQALFEAAFGAQLWQRLLAQAAGQPYLELAIRGTATDDDVALHALRWEALHDGTRPVAAQGSDCAASGTRVPVGIVRIIPLSPAAGAGAPALAPAAQWVPIARIPRVLFAIGSRLTDPKVRPGAEFMGIMRHLERDGGSIYPSVLQEATRPVLAHALAAFRPDVVHFIGHGRRFPDGSVKLQLHPEPGMKPGEEYVTAGQLLDVFGEAGHMPAMALLSACQTASGGSGDSGDGDPEDRVNALPFAARLVAGNGAAGGVPVVVAMAGDISDTASRVFTRALTAAIGDVDEDVPLARAVMRGRRAAFHNRPGYASSHWIMPTVFLADTVPGDLRLVDTAPLVTARKRVQRLGLAVDPVFCGRADFVTAMDRLLDGDDKLNVILGYTPTPYGSYGGERLLRELGARAVRAGVVPVLLAPFDVKPPTTRVMLAREVAKCLRFVRGKFGLPAPAGGSRAMAVAADDGADAVDLAAAIRADLGDLVAELNARLPETDPVRSRHGDQPRAVLLCHRVDGWDEAGYDLLDMLGPVGLEPDAPPLPVVLTGADTDAIREARLTRWSGKTWVKPMPLGRFSSDDDEDVLAYQWWLLNPPEDQPVYAPKRDAPDDWQELLRASMEDRPLYPDLHLYKWAQKARYFLTSDTDNALLAGYAQVQGGGAGGPAGEAP
jgi:CHAT domain